ncbi:MAG: family 1 glycosylhydrolase, partial [Eubacteriales bacterium]|nr:family 1 glycosylhydrolase [Eubacteriales bacterium]
MSSFPKGFLWGVACASYQCEGAWDADGKGPSIWDEFSHTEGNVLGGDTGDVACDCYHRYKEDVALMKKLGVQVYRFSISWPRVIPNGTGAVNEAGLQYYSDLIDCLLENGIEPWVTLYHWDLPSALQKKGGWLSRDTVDAFAEYAKIIAKRFDGRVKTYMTINEPQCVVGLGLSTGIHAPGWKLPNPDLALAMHHLVLAHGVGMKALQDNSSIPVRVGAVPCGRMCYPVDTDPATIDATYEETFQLREDEWVFTFNSFMDSVMFHKYPDDAPAFLKAFEKTIPASDWALVLKPDFLGVNIYNGYPVDRNGNRVKRATGFPLTACKWPVTPEVMHYGIV